MRIVSVGAALVASPTVRASQSHNFSLERYIPTPTGEQTFWVDRPDAATLKTPWRMGITGTDAHNALMVTHIASADASATTTAVVAHEVIGHVQLAASFFDKLTAALDVPLILQHRGEKAFGIGPGGTFAFSDFRLGAMMQILGADAHPHFNLHAGVMLWVPVASRMLASDRLPRIAHKAVMTGQIVGPFVYAATVNFITREHASVGSLPQTAGATASSEVQIGASLAWQTATRNFSIGPEAIASTSVERGLFFSRDASSLELLGGAHYAPNPHVQVGVAGGAGFFGAAGTPQYRVLLRVNVTPWLVRHKPESDRDEDSIVDARDACPDTFGLAQSDARVNGCPVDSDGDGVLDPYDVCPSVAMGKHPDKEAYGCPGPIVPAPEAVAPVAPAPPAAPAVEAAPAPHVEVKADQIVTDPLFFVFGKAELKATSLPVMAALSDMLKAHLEITQVIIEGHTDNAGKPAHNLDLSERRARSVRQALIDSGVAPTRLVAQGFGDTRPLAPNTTVKARAQNRRVEFHIVR